MSFISIKDTGVPKSRQIVTSIEQAILNKELVKGSKLPTINSIRLRFSISRDTVLHAYGELKARGIIQSVAGKGFYLIKEDISTSKRILLVFDELNPFKKLVYDGFKTNCNPDVEVDIFFHHFNRDILRNTIVNSIGNYSYYVIMPANIQDIKGFVSHLPKDTVYLLDQIHPDLKDFPAVYQNFEKGVYQCLKKLQSKIIKYQKLILFFDKTKQPIAIYKGFISFCRDLHIDFQVIESIDKIAIKKNTAYLTLEDATLITIVKQLQSKGWKMAKDIGIISYNDTKLKEVLSDGITVISADFMDMGKQLATMIAGNSSEKIESKINLTLRQSI